MSPIDWNAFKDGMEEGAQQALEDIAQTIMDWYDQQEEQIQNAEALQAQAVREGCTWVKLAGVDPNVKRTDGGKVVPCTCGGGNFMCGCAAKGGWLIPKGYKLAVCGECNGAGHSKPLSGLWYCPGCNNAGAIAVKK